MTFTEKVNKTFENLETLKPGCEPKSIANSIIAREYGIEAAIDVCKLFIDTHPNYELSNDYKFIKRLDI